MANRAAKVNQIRDLLGEFGIALPKGVARLRRELPGILEEAENALSDLAREALCGLLGQLRDNPNGPLGVPQIQLNDGQIKPPSSLEGFPRSRKIFLNRSF